MPEMKKKNIKNFTITNSLDDEKKKKIGT